VKIIIWFDLVAALVVGGFWVAQGRTGDWTNGWLVALAVLVLLMPFSIVPRARTIGGVPREFRDAPIGIGTVVGATRTGRSVNDQPELAIELRVDTGDGRTFPAVARQVVDVTELAAVRPDAILPVRYLSDGRVVLATDARPPELQAALDRVHMAKGWLTPRQLHIAEHGVDASAVVVSSTPAGPTGDGRLGTHLRLLVTRPDGSTFELTQEKKLPPASVAQVLPGMVVRVRYLPHDESDVAVLTAVLP
jgi:hypothetical protein